MTGSRQPRADATRARIVARQIEEELANAMQCERGVGSKRGVRATDLSTAAEGMGEMASPGATESGCRGTAAHTQAVQASTSVRDDH